MERGFVKLWRKTLDSGLLANGPACQLFHYLLLNTTHKPYRKIVGGMTFDLQPGDVVFGRKRAADDLNLSEKQVRTALKLLEKLEIVASKPTNKCTVISFVNWGIYQDVRPADGPTEGPAEGQQRASNGPTEGQQRATRQEHRTKNIEHRTEEEKRERPRKKADDQKLTFGEYQHVKLTQAEHDRLCEKYGAELTAKAIAFLDLHIGAKGKDDYKSHNLALQKWVFDAVKERGARQQARPPQQGRIGYIQDRERDFAHEAEICPF